MKSLIFQKRIGKALSEQAIHGWIEKMVQKKIPNYQTSALLMSIFFQNMNLKETTALTQAMVKSGFQYTWPDSFQPYLIDKHSTGGIGDKVSLILAPLAASCGLYIPMISGRSLGHTGGTLDKLSALPNIQLNFSQKEAQQILKKVHCLMMGQSQNLVPADRLLYAMRDVTGTVESAPLMVASILSKKIAEGISRLVMDVKVGSGAFLKTRTQARMFSKLLFSTAKALHLDICILMTDMNQPLGYTVGNALELREAMEVLSKKHTHLKALSLDLKELVIQLVAQMLVLGKRVSSLAQGRKMARHHLDTGKAWKSFQAMAQAQGVTISQWDHWDFLPKAPVQYDWIATQKQYLVAIDGFQIGMALCQLGGGRMTMHDSLDLSVGFEFFCKLGKKTTPEKPIVRIHAPSEQKAQEALRTLQQALRFSSNKKTSLPLIHRVILSRKDL